MRHMHWKRRLGTVLIAMIFVALAPRGFAGAAAPESKNIVFDTRIYQVLTNVTGDGLTSHTLPGMNGWLQVIHQRLDDVTLVMDGTTLTWNGLPEPDHPRIIRIAKPSLATHEGEIASAAIGEVLGPVQYMVRKDNDLFELKATEKDPIGVLLRLTPEAVHQESNLLDCTLSFRYSWVKGREKIDGVNLEIGRPLMGEVHEEGPVQMRLGEWSCYQAPADSEGWIYLFLRAEVVGKKELQEREEQLNRDKGTTNDVAETRDGKAGETAPQSGRPKVEVGGSVEVRGRSSSGGRK